MKIFRGHDSPFQSADASSFVGAAQTKLLGSAEEGTPVHVYHVRFEAGGRTNWHTHSGPQWLLVTEGWIRVQRWGEPPHDLSTGDAVVIPSDEKHWHGAVAGTPGVHLAVNVDAKTTWLEPVSDAVYENR
jgi:quercetin dioxygenase-like cupin family protein